MRYVFPAVFFFLFSFSPGVRVFVSCFCCPFLFFLFSPSLSTLVLFLLQLGEGRGGSTLPPTRTRHDDDTLPTAILFAVPSDGERGRKAAHTTDSVGLRVMFSRSKALDSPSVLLVHSLLSGYDAPPVQFFPSFFFFLFFCAVCVRVSALCAVFRVHIGCRRVCECL